ncbi:DHA2 family efflux MFS transporter permease subunit [Streptomyces sp. JNUCC 64]
MDQQTVRRGGTAWTLVITSAAGFMASLDNLVVTTALPAIREDLGGGLEELEWTVSAYTLTFAVLLMLGAALGDRFGRRRLFTVGLGVFTAASAAAALAPGTGGLIAARAVQGAGAAVMMPLTLTLLTAAVPAARRGAALGIWGAANGLGVALGPLVGGALTEYASWQWIFWLNVPVGLVLLPLARLRLAESRAPGARLDVPGTLLASLGLFGIVYALVDGNAHGWTDPYVLTSAVGGALLLVAFVGYERRAARPMLPMRLFRSRAFAGVNAAGLLMFLGMFGSIFLLSQYFQGVMGYSPVETGVRMLPWTAMPLLVAPFAGHLSDRIGARPVVATGLFLQALGLSLFAVTVAPDAGYPAHLPSLIVGGVGMALYFAPAASLLMSSVRPEERGIAAGAANALREVGGALGVALLASVFSANGGFGTGRRFVDGLVPALWIGVVSVGLAALAVLTVPSRRTPAGDDPAPATGPAARARTGTGTGDGDGRGKDGDREPAGV